MIDTTRDLTKAEGDELVVWPSPVSRVQIVLQPK